MDHRNDLNLHNVSENVQNISFYYILSLRDTIYLLIQKVSNIVFFNSKFKVQIQRNNNEIKKILHCGII